MTIHTEGTDGRAHKVLIMCAEPHKGSHGSVYRALVFRETSLIKHRVAHLTELLLIPIVSSRV